MKYVLGIDLGTSAVKVIAFNQIAEIVAKSIKSYEIVQKKSGYNEQDPAQWVDRTLEAIKEVISSISEGANAIQGISFSGQMHGLVLLDKDGNVLRPAILWNDTRTTEQCASIHQIIGQERLIELTENVALEGFTLPKILWVKENEPKLYEQVDKFLLPKDYVRYYLTNTLACEYSDAAGTLLLNVRDRAWSQEICDKLGINRDICPPLIESIDYVGTLLPSVAERVGLPSHVKVFAGGADNACGALGASLMTETDVVCSIGTSGVIMSYESNLDRQYKGRLHLFNHAIPNTYYAMGVTLAAGHSLQWWQQNFTDQASFESLLEEAEKIPVGARGLMFTPYLAGERTPYTDSQIRGTFIGIDIQHTRAHFTRAIIEGITFSLKDNLQILQQEGKEIRRIIAIGGATKSTMWLQMQANIFQTEVVSLQSEQGPALGAALIAACGVGWYNNLHEAMQKANNVKTSFFPEKSNVESYDDLYQIYKMIYKYTSELTYRLERFRA